MSAPLELFYDWGNGISYLIAFFIGIGFGFFLEMAGFGNSRLLALQFYFRNLTVFKVMFTAIITAMAGLIFLGAFGYLDWELIYINPTYLWPGVIGGLIMGVGFAVGGYCPGTGVVGLATLKTDALFYLGGAMAGMFIFGELEPHIADFFAGEGSGYMGVVTLDEFLGIPVKVIGFIIIIVALAGFWGAEIVEKKFGKEE